MIEPHSTSCLRRRVGLCFLLALAAPWRAQADFSLTLAVPTARWPQTVEGQFTSVMAPMMGRNLAYRATARRVRLPIRFPVQPAKENSGLLRLKVIKP